MNSIIAWWANNKVAANLLMVAILMSGVISFFTMNREIDPYVEFPGARVSVVWPGASPQDIEEQIVVRLEEALSTVNGLERLWGVANEGVGLVFVNGNQDLDEAAFLAEIKRNVDSISTFPSAAEPADVQIFRNRSEILRIAVSGNVDEKLLKRTAEKVRRDIALIGNVPAVDLFGVRNEEVSIEVSELDLKRYGLTLAEVANAVRGTSVNSSSGTVKTDLGRVQLRTRNQADTQEEFENIIVRQQANGAVVRVKDIATV
ncbi:MAG TPA: efflux RND transporter permease subunit, partial [Hellea balneolensis]|nr:efflux RND transporter permease subunit [Hellea balneolensis]